MQRAIKQLSIGGAFHWSFEFIQRNRVQQETYFRGMRVSE